MGPGSHVGFPISAKNKNLVYDHPMNISSKFGWNLFSGFREEDLNVKSCQTLTHDKSSHDLWPGELIKWVLYYQPEALKSLYRSPGNKKNQLVLCKNYVLRHLGITINIKNTKFVKDHPMIDAQFRFNQCNSFREEYISVFSPYGSVLILWPVVAAILDFRSA